MTNVLKAEQVSFRYQKDQKWLFQNRDFHFDCGKLVIIKGNSGSGKTTLLNILCSVIPKKITGFFSGEIYFENNPLTQYSLPQISPNISLMMQNPDLQLFFPTVELELAFGPENLNIEPTLIRERIDSVSQKLDIRNILQQSSSTLSFGQKKLTSFASLITLSPKVFLLDEPIAGLSAKNATKMKDCLMELRDQDKCIIATEHRKNLDDIADRIIEL